MLAREVPISRFSLKSSSGFYMFEQMQTCEMLKLCFAGVLWALSPETAVLVNKQFRGLFTLLRLGGCISICLLKL